MTVIANKFKKGDRVRIKNINFRNQIKIKTGQEVFEIEEVEKNPWSANKVNYRLIGLHFEVSAKTIELIDFKTKFKDLRKQKEA